MKSVCADARRFAILRDLDRGSEPLAVLFETTGGGATLYVFEDVPHGEKLRREYDDFDKALETWHRSALLTTVGREGASASLSAETLAVAKESRFSDEYLGMIIRADLAESGLV